MTDSCERNTSIHQGVPRLIRPMDVDVEFSMNKDCPDHSIQQLPVIVPSEAASSLGIFRQQISLYQIFSEVLDQLYTTWNRRDGCSKIHRLHDKLSSWKTSFDAHTASQHSLGSPMGTESFSVYRLRVLAEFARLLIHRTAITFNESEPQFQTSLVIAVESSQTLILLLQDSLYPERLMLTWPFSMPAVLQLGLMLLYPYWIEAPYACLRRATLYESIDKACHLLDAGVKFSDARELTQSDSAKRDSASRFLRELAHRTVTQLIAPESETPRRGEDITGSIFTDALETMNFMDWQSLMLPNDFLYSEMDLVQGFEGT
jgi:hypothetical protein